MPYKINIPKPCHEDWNKFIPSEQGKHCQVCATTVIDFTNWQPNAIANYMAANIGKEVCGRFKKTQLQTEIPTADAFARQISYFRMPTLKKIAAIFLFAFVLQNNSFAADATVHGGISVTPTGISDFNTLMLDYKYKDVTKKITKPKKKVAKKKKVASKKYKKGKVKIVVKKPESMIMGKMMMPEHN
jgi:hypothetical protein